MNYTLSGLFRLTTLLMYTYHRLTVPFSLFASCNYHPMHLLHHTISLSHIPIIAHLLITTSVVLWALQIEKAVKALKGDADAEDKDKDDKDKDNDNDKDNNKGTGSAQWWQVLNYPVWEYSTDPLIVITLSLSLPSHCHIAIVIVIQVLNYPVWEHSTDPLIVITLSLSLPSHCHIAIVIVIQVLNYPVWEYSTDPLDWFTEYDDRLKAHLLLVTSWKVHGRVPDR